MELIKISYTDLENLKELSTKNSTAFPYPICVTYTSGVQLLSLDCGVLKDYSTKVDVIIDDNIGSLFVAKSENNKGWRRLLTINKNVIDKSNGKLRRYSNDIYIIDSDINDLLDLLR